MDRWAVRILTSRSDKCHRAKVVDKRATSEARVRTREPSSATGEKRVSRGLPSVELRCRPHEKKLLLLVVMSRMAGETVRMCLRVGFVSMGLVAAVTSCQNSARRRPCVGPDPTGIAPGLDMFRAGPMAAFATATGRLLALQGLCVCRLREAFVRLFVAALADFGSDILSRFWVWGILRWLLGKDTQAGNSDKPSQPRQKPQPTTTSGKHRNSPHTLPDSCAK
jgi:hypothetical protein